MDSRADEVVAILKEAGVSVMFGIPSIHNIPLYEALRKEPSIKHILCRQESSAGHMADGYARARGGLGVVLASTGPGLGYTVPSTQEAFGANSPMLVVTTNIAVSKIGQGIGSLHEVENQDTIFGPITKATFCVRAEEDIPDLTRRAIATALSGRRGPVYLEVPTDLLDRTISRKEGMIREQEAHGETIPGLEKAASLLDHARRPLIIAGTDAVRSGIAKDIVSLAEILAAPVITTTEGKGVIAEDHSLAFGNVVRKGVVREMVTSCDVVLAIGTRLREVDAKRRWLDFPHLIHVDWDNCWVNRNFSTEVALLGNIPLIAKALVDRLTPGPGQNQRQRWIAEMKKKLETEVEGIRQSHIEVQYLEVIRQALPRDGILVIDNTQLGYWAEYFYPSCCPGGLVSAKGSAAIGFAFPAAIGAKIAYPDRKVIGLIGDGGFLYGAHELATCIRHKIGFPLILINDNAYGVIGYLQRAAYKTEYESWLTNPDFVALAQAFGAQAVRVDSPNTLCEALNMALFSEDMWVIELVGLFPELPFGRY